MTADLAVFERALARTARRMRLQRALEWAVAAALLGAGALAVGHVIAELAARPLALGSELAAFAGVTVLAGALGASLAVPDERAAAALDRAGNLRGRMRAAVEFRRAVPERLSPFAAAALRDAVAHAALASPRQAAPYHRPRAAWLALAVMAASAGALSWRRGAASEPRAPSAAEPASAGALLAQDDLAAFRAALEALLQRAGAQPESAELERYAALLAALEQGAIGHEQALSELLALESRLSDARDAPREADGAALRALGSELAAARPGLAELLQQGDRKRAAAELKALGEAVRRGELEARERERLAQALAQVRERERSRAEQETRERELEGLLRRSEPRAANDPREQSLLKRTRRELESLRTRRQREANLHRELERLSRELARAGGSLPAQSEQAGEALSRGGEALEQFERAQQRADQRRDLAREVAQLRELVQRDQGAPRARPERNRPERDRPGETEAQSREQRRERFSLRARGADEDAGAPLQLRVPAGDPPGPGREQGDGGSGQDERTGPEPGEARELRAGSDGPEDGPPGQLEGSSVLRETIEVPGQGGGDEHDETRLPAPTQAEASYQDRQLAGAHSAGPTRSQVILGAARGGFSSASYQKVYSDYRAHAEELIERDDVPPGYRFYVRRYFQLVRPRREQAEVE